MIAFIVSVDKDNDAGDDEDEDGVDGVVVTVDETPE